jgi:transcriptional regulator with XRE-family HTH domain
MGAANEPATLGGRLQKVRLLAGISQSELSRLADAKRSYVGLIERGERTRPEALHLTRLAEVLGVHVKWLLTGQGPGPSAQKIRASVAAARAAARAAPSAAE